QVRREIDDRADIQIAVRPAVQPAANSRREGIVYGGMTQRALDADRFDILLSVEKSRDTDDGIQLQQRESSSGVVQIDSSFRDALAHGIGQRVHIHLQSHSQRRFRTDAWPHTPELLSGDRLMQLKCITPEPFVPEGVEPKDLATPPKHVNCIGGKSE